MEKNMKTAVQQIMLGSVTGTKKEAQATLQAIKEAGYDGIELNGFMIRPTPFLVRMLTKAAGMPTGKGGKLDWKNLVEEAGLSVVSVHEDLGTIERNIDAVIAEARNFGTDKIVITGMYRFDYSDTEAVSGLCRRLNSAGEKLADAGISLLYHNHNVEFQNYYTKNIYGHIVEETKADFVGFELDSYWIADAGVDPLTVMQMLGDRMKLYHIMDRGSRQQGASMTPILKQDCVELGYGNMNLGAYIEQAKSAAVDAIVLESHKNWIDKDPVRSLTVSSEFLNKNVR